MRSRSSTPAISILANPPLIGPRVTSPSHRRPSPYCIVLPLCTCPPFQLPLGRDDRPRILFPVIPSQPPPPQLPSLSPPAASTSAPPMAGRRFPCRPSSEPRLRHRHRRRRRPGIPVGAPLAALRTAARLGVLSVRGWHQVPANSRVGTGGPGSPAAVLTRG